MGLRSPLRFDNLTGLEPHWRRPMSWPEIAILVLILIGIVYLIWELRK
jgi:hypothetical protein